MSSAVRAPRRLNWRILDIVVATLLAVVSGLIFWSWNLSYSIPAAALGAVLPGLDGLLGAPWLLGGLLGGLIIRKPGAALYTETVAAVLSMLFGAAWGADTLLSGLLQGLGAELIFLVFAYRNYRLGVVMLAGAAAVALELPHQLIVWYAETTAAFQIVYSVSMLLSGAVIGGIGAWAIVRGLAATGALDRFAAGRVTPRSA